MKAEHVHNFTRGGNPYSKLKVGDHRPYTPGDWFEVTKTVMWDTQNHTWISPENFYLPGMAEMSDIENFLRKGIIIRLEKIEDWPVRGDQTALIFKTNNKYAYVFPKKDKIENFLKRI